MSHPRTRRARTTPSRPAVQAPRSPWSGTLHDAAHGEHSMIRASRSPSTVSGYAMGSLAGRGFERAIGAPRLLPLVGVLAEPAGGM